MSVSRNSPGERPSHLAHLPLLAAGLALLALSAWGPLAAPEQPFTDVWPWLNLPMVALWGGGCWWVWGRPGLRVWPIIALAVACRFAAASGPPALSSDVYRYPWDGRVQRAGVSPWAHPPKASELAHLRDDIIHPQINRPGARTVYPPGAQWLFRVLPFDVDQVRWLMIALDLLTMLLLARLLALRGRDPARVVLYGFAPLAIWEVGNGGHLEAAMLPALVGAVVLLSSHRPRRRLATAGLLFGQAVAMKFYPLALVPALWRRGRVRLLAFASLVVGGLYIAYGWQADGQVLGFLPEYVSPAEDHNIGLRQLFDQAASALGLARPRITAFAACGAVLLAGMVWLHRRTVPLVEHLLALSGLWLFCLPTAVHPWYALWLLPWLAVNPRPQWLWLVAVLPFSYLKYGAVGGLMPDWVVPLEWGPVVILWAVWRIRESK